MQPGSRIGAWEVMGELGRGGFGVVLRARHATGQEAALKLLLDPHDPDAAARFAREVRLLSASNHPALVRVFDHGLSAQGLPWLAMELLTGGSLARRVAMGGPLELEQALALARALAGALATLHAAGVVHRDLKPENVLFDRDGAPRVTDLGLGRRFLPGASRLTATGALLGTPAYMSPEQANGEALGPASDVWAAGATLYFALTGRAPFRAPEPLALLYQVLQAAPEPPSALRRDLPRPLEALVLRCLEKDPAARFADGAALLEALSALEAGLAAQANPQGPAPRGRRALWASVALGGVGSALLAALWAGRGSPDRGAPLPAPTPASPAEPAADPLRAEVEALLARAERRVSQESDPQGGVALLDQALALAGATPLAARPLAARSVLSGALGQREAALADARRALALDAECAQAHQALGLALTRVPGELPAARQALDRALELEPRLALARVRRAQLLRDTGDDRAALSDLDHLLAERTTGTADSVELRLMRAELLLPLRRLEDALRDLDQALRVQPDQPNALLLRGQVLRDLGRAEQGLRDLDRFVEQNPQRPDGHLARAHLLANLSRTQEALAALERAQALARTDRTRAAAHALRGGILRSLDLQRAQEELSRALELDPGSTHALGLRAELRLSARDARGAWEDAQAALRRAPTDPLALAVLGEARLELGDPGGLADLERAIAIDPRQDRAIYRRGLERLRQGDREAARRDVLRALELSPDAPGPARRVGRWSCSPAGRASGADVPQRPSSTSRTRWPSDWGVKGFWSSWAPLTSSPLCSSAPLV